MSRLPPIKRLATEDFPGEKSWISKLLQPVNSFFESVTEALNKGLTFSDNMSAVVRQIEVPGVPSGTPYPLYFAWTLKAKPIGLWVVAAYEKAGVHATFAAAISADWEFTAGGLVQINSFAGLPTSAAYIVTVIAITG